MNSIILYSVSGSEQVVQFARLCSSRGDKPAEVACRFFHPYPHPFHFLCFFLTPWAYHVAIKVWWDLIQPSKPINFCKFLCCPISGTSCHYRFEEIRTLVLSLDGLLMVAQQSHIRKNMEMKRTVDTNQNGRPDLLDTHWSHWRPLWSTCQDEPNVLGKETPDVKGTCSSARFEGHN